MASQAATNYEKLKLALLRRLMYTSEGYTVASFGEAQYGNREMIKQFAAQKCLVI